MEMKKSNLFFLLFGIIVFIAGIVGITYALTSYSSTTTNKVTTGSLATKIVEEYTMEDNVLPGNEVDKVVTVKNTGGIDELVRVKVTKAWGSSRLEDGTLVQTDADKSLSTNNILITYDTTHWLDGNDGYYYYKGILTPSSTTESLFDKFTISKTTGNEYKNKLADIIVTAEAIQTKGDAVSNIWNKTYDDLGIEAPATTSDTTPTLVTYVSPTQKFTFSETNGDLFANFKNLEPGESKTQNITLTNSYNNPQTIYLKAENTTQDEETKTKVDKFIKEYLTVTIKNGSETIYTGPIWGNLDSDTDTMKNDILLGTLAKDATKNLTVTLSVASTMPNEYQDLTGNINWTFTTYETDATLIVHHYIDGTTDKVPNNTSGTVNDETTAKVIGDEYTTSASTEISNNYIYKEVLSTGDPANGTIEKSTTEVTYYYELKPATVITHHYVEGTTDKVPSTTEGETISDVTQTKKYTDTYTTSAATNANTNYELVETPANATGTVSQDTIEVIYYYKLKDSTVITHYYVEGTTDKVPSATNGETISDVTQAKKYGDTYTTSAATNVSTNYELVETPENATGTVSQDTIEVVYYYKLKDATLVVCHYITGTTTPVKDNNNDDIECTNTATKYGLGYTSSAKSVGELASGWAYQKLADSSDGANGTISKDTTSVIYYYTTDAATFDTPTITKDVEQSIIKTNKETLNYSIEYNEVIKSYVGNVTVTIVDTLPATIDEESSDLNGGVYSAEDKTITWTYSYDDLSISGSDYTINKEINFIVKYTELDYVSKKMTNIATGTINFEATSQNEEVSDDAFINVDARSEVIVHHYLKDTTTKLASDEVLFGDVGDPYVTSNANVTGYEVITVPSNKTGNYTPSIIEVTYYYIPLRTITVTKEINLSSINNNHGDPSFTYKIVNNGVTYIKQIIFDKEFVDDYIRDNSTATTITKNVAFNNLSAKETTLSEVSSYRYDYNSIKDITGGTETSGVVTFDLVNNASGSATYVNDKNVQNGNSDGYNLTNSFDKTVLSLVSIAATYNGGELLPGDTINLDDLVVIATYSDGVTEQNVTLASTAYTSDLDKYLIPADAENLLALTIIYRDSNNYVTSDFVNIPIS